MTPSTNFSPQRAPPETTVERLIYAHEAECHQSAPPIMGAAEGLSRLRAPPETVFESLIGRTWQSKPPNANGLGKYAWDAVDAEYRLRRRERRQRPPSRASGA